MAHVAVEIQAVERLIFREMRRLWGRAGWRKSFEYCVAAKGLERAAQKQAFLLQCAGSGMEVQEPFDILVDPGPAVVARDADGHVIPDTADVVRTCITYIESPFKKQAQYCNFPNRDYDIRDQVIDKC
jgi:hypothetical protein